MSLYCKRVVSWQPPFAAPSGPTSVHAKALLPTGCSQPMTKLRRCTGARYLALHGAPLPGHLGTGVSCWPEIFSEMHDHLRLFLPDPSPFSISFTGVRPASCLMDFPDYSWFLSPLFPQLFPCNKSLALLIPSWCLHPGESKSTQTLSKHSFVHLCFVYSCHSVQPRCFF